MKSFNVIDKIAHRPVESIGAVLAIGFIIVGIIVLLPGFSVQDGATLQYIHTLAPIRIIGVLFIGLFGLHLYGLATKNYKIRRFCTFAAFCLFIFFGVLRLLLIGVDNLVWMNSVIFALIEGISYVRLKWGLDG